MTFYRILWGIDLPLALVAFAFFAIGIADGTVSSFNIALWLAILAGVTPSCSVRARSPGVRCN